MFSPPTLGEGEVSLASLHTSIKEPSAEPTSSRVTPGRSPGIPVPALGVGGALPWMSPPSGPFLPHGSVPRGGTMTLTLQTRTLGQGGGSVTCLNARNQFMWKRGWEPTSDQQQNHSLLLVLYYSPSERRMESSEDWQLTSVC